ncbi:endonuclease [Methylococcaceae bacterium CS1]|nr:endonuclease/exonuclease/phosphatase family protein [Methyloprofundus sp.]TXK96981.1 endonuclease [Methylococcaceae bacterium CS4]TXK98348.1 endonuclease [Methylococcaceae bacterium CS5]TXL04488.1 endonuclease [Methylococcaceae bacterium CS3]TXL05989.1 endonuclease [Methylococcaceae bacterium CS1]TXL10555.1 endonuclease [Methylococcaceae bacterium CS2]TXL17603.1 endonuclease [Methylococcaceae bacterium HT3]TXL18994.1 endonuclease [Methylococcaceae bacterium HT5]TXL22758.1 endonuclease [M
MNQIKLLYVENIIFRKTKQVQQKLSFFLALENIGYDKQVDIHWAGEDGIWQILPAQYHSMMGHGSEYWSASITLSLSEKHSLPGNIQFNLRYRVQSHEYLIDNHSQNYSSEADSGLKLTDNQSLQNVDFDSQLQIGQQTTSVCVAIARSFNAKKVTIHWTTNDWKTTKLTVCTFKRDYWNKAAHSNARNPNQYGNQLWSGKIHHTELFNLKYVISCENDQQTIWDNNDEHDYSFQREQLKILILNLHCYQEENQDEKFTTIAKTIDDLNVDIVCLQEVAEYWNDGHGDWPSNSAKIINDRLSEAFYLHTDWSHLGFDKYREGVAILSRYPLSNQDSGYVSDSHDIYDINSRKVVTARIYVPYIGFINVFSAHLSWLEGGFQEQFIRLRKWAGNIKSADIKATLLCGDFNITAGSSGYKQVVNSNEYEDQYLAINKQGVFDKIFKVNDAHWQDLLADDYRIDYIFMNKNSEIQATSARVVFTDQDVGRVSDHCGYLMTFESL